MKAIEVLACGKINLSLDIVSVLDDGYHGLDMCLTTIDCGDIVRFTLSNEQIVYMNGCRVGDENTAYRALRAVVRSGLISGGIVEITKKLPFSSGMGGSSVDAAAVLYATARIIGVKAVRITENTYSDYGCYRLDYSDIRYRRLEVIGSMIGSDIVYLMRGGCCRATGKGDDIVNIGDLPLKALVIVAGGGAVTSRVFSEYDRIRIKSRAYTAAVIRQIKKGEMITKVGNGLTSAAEEVNPNIITAIRDMRQYTKTVNMTGSGSGVFGVFEDADQLLKAKEELSKRYCFCEIVYSTPVGMMERKK